MFNPLVRVIPRLLIWAGLVTLAYTGATVAYSLAYQRQQSRKFDKSVEARYATVEDADKSADLNEGDLVGKLEIARISLSVMILQGIEESTLTLGAGHVPGTPLPAVAGNVVIAAHRDTFFRKLKDIAAGDAIRVSIRNRTYLYIAKSTEVVDPENTHVMESGTQRELTLITCFPFYYVGAAPKRFVVHAELASANVLRD